MFIQELVQLKLKNIIKIIEKMKQNQEKKEKK